MLFRSGHQVISVLHSPWVVMRNSTSVRSGAKSVAAVAIVAVTVAVGCRSRHDQGVFPAPTEAKLLPQDLVSLPLYRRPFNSVDLDAAAKFLSPLDSDSVEMFEYRGGTYYHPVNLCNRCYSFLAAYGQTKDSTYLKRVEKSVGRLAALVRVEDSTAWVPYQFDFAVHGDSANLMKAPWYSGMAQGEVLSIVMRLYELTEDRQYLTFGRRLFYSLIELKQSGLPWVARLDSDGFYWIEEYPHDVRPDMTLNGFIVALFGVYDYYVVTGDERARRVWDMSLTTLKHYLPQYLLDTGSYYCLGHKLIATATYHRFHISLLNYLYTMTGDRYFKIMAEAYEKAASS